MNKREGKRVGLGVLDWELSWLYCIVLYCIALGFIILDFVILWNRPLKCTVQRLMHD